MNCTDKERETCNVEKMGCAGCYYSNDIENDLERCNKLAQERNGQWLGNSNILAIRHVVTEVRRLREERDEIYADYQDLGKEYYNSIPKDKIKEKIEELKKEYKKALKENSTKAFILKCKIEALEELLKGE